MRNVRTVLGNKSFFRLEWVDGQVGSSGTATPIHRDGYFLTAAHCVPDSHRAGAKLSVVNGGNRHVADVVRRWPDRDLALIFCPTPMHVRQVFALSDSELAGGQRIAIAGLPGLGVNSARRWWQGRADVRGARNGEIAVYLTLRRKHRRVRRGASGGPAVDNRRMLVGICVKTGRMSRKLRDVAPFDLRIWKTMMSKAYLQVVLQTEITFYAAWISPLAPVMGELQLAIAADQRERSARETRDEPGKRTVG